MNIRKLNLNFLKVLDALLTERHVSRAADRVFLTQPAVSNALIQLREIFKDPLLVRGKKSMVLTPLAVTLAPQVHRVLQEIEDMLMAKEFEAATAHHHFYLGVSDYAECIILPELLEQSLKIAPGISYRIKPLPLINDVMAFEENKIDLAIGLVKSTSPIINSELLLTESAICAVNVKHSLAKGKLTLKKYLTAKHISISYYDDPVSSVTDKTLAEMGHHRDIAISTPNLLVIPSLLASASLMATIPKQIAKLAQQTTKLKLFAPPFAIPDVKIYMVWHRRYDQDAKHIWLRAMIKNSVKSL